jgi:P4 family phage/plasmid primase-like protien
MTNRNGNGSDPNDFLPEADELELDELPKGTIVNKKLHVRGKLHKTNVSPTVRYSNQLLEKLGKVRCKKMDWFRYKDGRWVERNEEMFLPAAISVIPPEDRNSKRANDLVTFVRQRTQLTEDETFYGAIRYSPDDNGRYLINCLSNVLEMDCASGKIVRTLNHDANYMFLSKLGANYNSEAIAPLFMKAAKETSPDIADRELLLDFSSTILLPNSPHECALICIGEGGNGKSVIMDSIASAIGSDNVGRLTIRQICSNDRKHLYRLKYKLLNLSTETEVNEINENTTLKTIISNEEFSTDRMYKSGFEMQTPCKLCFLANNMPKFKAGSNAEARRFRVVNFPNTFEGANKDTSLKHRLEAEREGILRMLIERIPSIIGLSELEYGSKASQTIYGDFKVSNDPTKAFVDDCLILDQKDREFITRKDLFRAFCNYAEKYNISTAELDKGTVFKKMYRYAPKLRAEEYRTMLAGKQEYVIRKVMFSELGRRLATKML